MPAISTSNYKVTLTVQLEKDGDVLVSASNFIVYTNAEIIPDYITG
jgi:hypothetical protein